MLRALWDGLMAYRSLNSNYITMIPANAFTNLPSLQILFVLFSMAVDDEIIVERNDVLQVLV
jgi:hypothetical protein